MIKFEEQHILTGTGSFEIEGESFHYEALARKSLKGFIGDLNIVDSKFNKIFSFNTTGKTSKDIKDKLISRLEEYMKFKGSGYV